MSIFDWVVSPPWQRCEAISFQDVFFPTVIVCNINQIRSSLFRSLGVSNERDIDLLYRQFYSGMDRNLTEREQEAILKIATSEVTHKIL